MGVEASMAASICARSFRTSRCAITRRVVVSAICVRCCLMDVCKVASSFAWAWFVSSVSAWSKRSSDAQSSFSAACMPYVVCTLSRLCA